MMNIEYNDKIIFLLFIFPVGLFLKMLWFSHVDTLLVALC
jgi:hypothetical protein